MAQFVLQLLLQVFQEHQMKFLEQLYKFMKMVLLKALQLLFRQQELGQLQQELVLHWVVLLQLKHLVLVYH